MYSAPIVSQQLVPADLARLQAEMDQARQVLFSLLPKKPPSIPGLDLWGVSHPALHVGGDFYDFIARPNQPLTFFIGDVCGKGLAAALLMPMVRSILRSEADFQPTPTPETILRNANRKLLADLGEACMFVTAFVGQYDPFTQELLYANAGHSPVIYRPAVGEAQLLQADGTAIGVLQECFSCNHRLLLNPGDLFIAATDGLNEARNSHHEYFGLTRLLNHVHSLDGQPAVEISNILLRVIRHFTYPEPQTDDQTLVVLRCTGK